MQEKKDKDGSAATPVIAGDESGEGVPCENCGRPQEAARMAWDSRQGGWLCRECLAEIESCGCSD